MTTWAEDLIAGMRLHLAPEAGARPPEDQPLGYGRDLWCTSAVTEDLRELDPSSPLGMAQLALRAITTPRDSAPDAPGRGTDVKLWLSKGVTDAELLAYEGMIIGEIEQDDRNAEVEASVERAGTPTIPALRIRFRVTPRAGVPYAFVILVPETGQAMQESLTL